MSDECNCITKAIIRRLEASGYCRRILKDMLDYDILDGLFLSKHDPFWNSTDEQTGERLHKIRFGLLGIVDELNEIYALLEGTDER